MVRFTFLRRRSRTVIYVDEAVNENHAADDKLHLSTFKENFNDAAKDEVLSDENDFIAHITREAGSVQYWSIGKYKRIPNK